MDLYRDAHIIEDLQTYLDMPFYTRKSASGLHAIELVPIPKGM
jgi:hypothetical protein